MSKYRTAQVCLNGHAVTDRIETSPEQMQDFCSKCGECTITTCPTCNTPIRGDYDVPGVVAIGFSYHPPLYCHNCGNPFPWTKTKITSAIEMFLEFGDLSDTEKQSIESDIENIAKDTPQTKLSAMRIKRIWNRGVTIGRDLLMEFASKTAAEILKS